MAGGPEPFFVFQQRLQGLQRRAQVVRYDRKQSLFGIIGIGKGQGLCAQLPAHPGPIEEE